MKVCNHAGHNDSLETAAGVSQNSNDQSDKAKFQRINYTFFLFSIWCLWILDSVNCHTNFGNDQRLESNSLLTPNVLGVQQKDVHLLTGCNQTPATPDRKPPPPTETPRTLPRGPFIGLRLGGAQEGWIRQVSSRMQVLGMCSHVKPLVSCFCYFSVCWLDNKWGIPRVLTLTHANAVLRPRFIYLFILLWGECCATDVELERKHLKAKGRIFGCPVWKVTSFWV